MTAIPERSNGIEPTAMIPAIPTAGSEIDWESFCLWLTNELHGVAVSLEQREGTCSRLESHFHPLENFTTRLTPNGVRIVTVTIRTNGHSRAFEISGPNSVTVRRNPAGRTTRLEIRNDEGSFVLYFCPPLPAPPTLSANAWGE